MSERNFAAFTWVWGCFLGLVAGLSIGYRTGTLNMKRWQDAYYQAHPVMQLSEYKVCPQGHTCECVNADCSVWRVW
jgi:hypothetical protein